MAPTNVDHAVIVEWDEDPDDYAAFETDTAYAFNRYEDCVIDCGGNRTHHYEFASLKSAVGFARDVLDIAAKHNLVSFSLSVSHA